MSFSNYTFSCSIARCKYFYMPNEELGEPETWWHVKQGFSKILFMPNAILGDIPGNKLQIDYLTS